MKVTMSKSQDTDLAEGEGVSLKLYTDQRGGRKGEKYRFQHNVKTKLNHAIFSSIQSPSLCKDVGDGGDYGVSVSVLVLPLQTITESVDTFPRGRAQPRV